MCLIYIIDQWMQLICYVIAKPFPDAFLIHYAVFHQPVKYNDQGLSMRPQSRIWLVIT